MSKLTIYDPVAGGFYLKTESFDIARNIAKSAIGENVFKKGYSAGLVDGATKPLLEAYVNKGIAKVAPTGRYSGVDYVQTRDSAGNTYEKLRVSLTHADPMVPDLDYLVSVDLSSDVAKRLIAKLLNCQVGQIIKLSAWPDLEPKGSRVYINHCVSVKDAQGVEIPAEAGLFLTAKERAQKLIDSLGINDAKVISSIRKSEQHKLFLEQIDVCKTVFEMAA